MNKKKKNGTRTQTFSSLEKQNTTATIIKEDNNNNNNQSNSKKNIIKSKENNNTLSTIALRKTDPKCNHAAIKEEKPPVPRKALIRQNSNLEKYPQKNQIGLPKLKDRKSTGIRV